MVHGYGGDCQCSRCDLGSKVRGKYVHFEGDEYPTKVNKEDLCKQVQDKEEKQVEKEEFPNDEKETAQEISEQQDPNRVYERMRTSNQEYGIWNFDPSLKDKDWYKVRRHPIKSSFMSRYYHETATGIHI